MSADNAWFVIEDKDEKFYVFGGFMSYVEEWDSQIWGPEYSLEEKREYILRHPGIHKSFDSRDEAILYAHRLDQGEEDSYWNPKTDMFGFGTEYGVCVIGKLDFSVTAPNLANSC